MSRRPIEVWITPKSDVFAIWGVIDLMLLVMCGYGLVSWMLGKAEDVGNVLVQERIGWLFAISTVLNVIWLYLWNNNYIIMIPLFDIILLTAIVGIAYYRVAQYPTSISDHLKKNGITNQQVEDVERQALLAASSTATTPLCSKKTWIEYWSVQAPLGIYAAWLLVAATDNAGLALFPIDPDHPFETIRIAQLSLIALIIVSLLSMRYTRGDMWIPIVCAVAVGSIPYSQTVLKYKGDEGEASSLITTCFAGIGVLGFACFAEGLRSLCVIWRAWTNGGRDVVVVRV